jgi:hypothetical protein
MMTDVQTVDARNQNLASRLLEHKLQKLEREVGNKPLALPADVNAPTLWGSIGALGSKLDGVANIRPKDFSPLVASLVSKVIEPFKNLFARLWRNGH